MSTVLVNIHGAGQQMSDFYVEALEALTAILGSKPAVLPCWYADLSNIGAAVRDAQPSLPPEAQDFQAAFQADIQQRALEIQQAGSTAAAPRGLSDVAFIAADVVSDVTRYLFDARLQEDIKQRLDDVLARAARDYNETVLAAHSLGTVVAFDVLREGADRFKISKFFTLGCPLRKLVRFGRRSSDLGAINETTVPLWRNLYDTTDPVADAIGPAFPGYPIQDVFIQIATSPVLSHDYWRNAQVLRMIAAALQP